MWVVALWLALQHGVVQAQAGKEMVLTVGGQHTLELPGGVQRMALADESVVAVSIGRMEGPGHPARLLFTPLKPGMTTLMVWPTGASKAETYVLKVQQQVQVHKGQVRSLPDQALQQAVHEAQAGEKPAALESGTVQLKSNVVQVDVKVVEFNKNQLKQAGINLFSTQPNRHGFSFGVLSSGSTASASWGANGQLSVEASAPLAQAFGLLLNFGKAQIGVDLGLLESNGLARVLAAPTLVALSGQSANFLAGGEIPIPVGQGQGMISIEYKSFGVGLTVSPTVLDDNRIVLKVAPEASELDYTNAVTLQSVAVPAITTRRADTTVELGDGESFVIGGLVSQNTFSTVEKVPLLGDIPILGTLFKRQDFSRRERELVIVVTPHLVRPLARGVSIDDKLPGATAVPAQSRVWGPYLAGAASRDDVPGFSR